MKKGAIKKSDIDLLDPLEWEAMTEGHQDELDKAGQFLSPEPDVIDMDKVTQKSLEERAKYNKGYLYPKQWDEYWDTMKDVAPQVSKGELLGEPPTQRGRGAVGETMGSTYPYIDKPQVFMNPWPMIYGEFPDKNVITGTPREDAMSHELGHIAQHYLQFNPSNDDEVKSRFPVFMSNESPMQKYYDDWVQSLIQADRYFDQPNKWREGFAPLSNIYQEGLAETLGYAIDEASKMKDKYKKMMPFSDYPFSKYYDAYMQDKANNYNYDYGADFYGRMEGKSPEEFEKMRELQTRNARNIAPMILSNLGSRPLYNVPTYYSDAGQLPKGLYDKTEYYDPEAHSQGNPMYRPEYRASAWGNDILATQRKKVEQARLEKEDREFQDSITWWDKLMAKLGLKDMPSNHPFIIDMENR